MEFQICVIKHKTWTIDSKCPHIVKDFAFGLYNWSHSMDSFVGVLAFRTRFHYFPMIIFAQYQQAIA